jgi:hypothetical protein
MEDLDDVTTGALDQLATESLGCVVDRCTAIRRALAQAFAMGQLDERRRWMEVSEKIGEIIKVLA